MKTTASILIAIAALLTPLQAEENQKIPMQKQLQSISPLLQVSDMKKSVEFYAGKLGFKEKWRDGDGFVILSRDGCDLYLGQNQTKVDLRNATARTESDGFASYDLHFHCAVGAADALWKEFTKVGVNIPEKDGPITREYGIRDFTVIDPDGYAIVFGSPVE
jgi:catechol 2,3-dioxygenase-like lactoylglutathione lyase family enzyme